MKTRRLFELGPSEVCVNDRRYVDTMSLVPIFNKSLQSSIFFDLVACHLTLISLANENAGQ